MATSTPHLLLRKPAPSDLANVTTDLSDNMDKIDAGLAAIARPPRCKVTRLDNTHAVVNATVVPVTWTAEEYDASNMWSAAAPTKLFAPVAGYYRVIAGIQFQAYAPGAIRVIQAYRYTAAGVAVSSIWTAQYTPNGSWLVGGTNAADIFFAAGEYAEMSVYQNSGVTNVLDGLTYPMFAIMRLVSVN